MLTEKALIEENAYMKKSFVFSIQTPTRLEGTKC